MNKENNIFNEINEDKPKCKVSYDNKHNIFIYMMIFLFISFCALIIHFRVNLESDDNNLKSLQISNNNIELKYNQTSYFLDVDSTLTNLDIEAIANHKKASVRILNKEPLQDGINIIKIEVISQSKIKKEYIIYVTRNNHSDISSYNQVNINDINICNDDVYCSSFYRFYINENIKSIDITAATNNSNFELYENKTYQLKEGYNKIVYGKNKTEEKDMIIEIYVIPNSMNTTKNNAINIMIEIAPKYSYGTFEMIANTSHYMIDETPWDESGIYLECTKKECETVETLKKYLIDNYSLSNRFADEIIAKGFESEFFKIENNILYFRTIITGFEGGPHIFSKYYTYKSTTYLIMDIIELGKENEVQSSERITFTYEHGKYVADAIENIGKELILK